MATRIIWPFCPDMESPPFFFTGYAGKGGDVRGSEEQHPKDTGQQQNAGGDQQDRKASGAAAARTAPAQRRAAVTAFHIGSLQNRKVKRAGPCIG